MRREFRKKFFTKKRVIVTTAIVVVLAVAALFALEKTGVTSFFSKKSGPETAQTTSESKSAQPDYTGDPNAEQIPGKEVAGNTLREDRGSAVVTDSGGAASSDTSQPIASSTGEVTVYLPHANSTLKSGQEISGTSTLGMVQYRLIDNLTGVIASGPISVINGRFSGTLTFNTGAREGRLDIFGTRADASEFSNVEIPVRFSQ